MTLLSYRFKNKRSVAANVIVLPPYFYLQKQDNFSRILRKLTLWKLVQYSRTMIFLNILEQIKLPSIHRNKYIITNVSVTLLTSNHQFPRGIHIIMCWGFLADGMGLSLFTWHMNDMED